MSESALRHRAAPWLDLIILLLVCASILIARTGGAHALVAGVHLSARGAARPAAVAALLLLVRLVSAPRVPLFASRFADWRRRFRRLYVRTADDAAGEAVSWRATAIVMTGLCVVGALMLRPQLRHMYAVPDMGDPLLSMWRAGWVLQQLRGDPRSLFDANIFYPEPLTFTYSDSMLLPGLTAAPMLAAGVHAVVAYNVLLISGFVLSGLAAALLVERLTASSPAAFVAGIVFGFYPYHFEHYSHLELQMMQWMPLALLALHYFLATLRGRYIFAAALAVVAQLYSSMYYAVFFSIYATVVFGILIASRRPPLRRMLLPAGAAAVLAVICALPLIRPYQAATPLKGERGREEVTIFSAEPSDYLRSHFRSARYGDRMLENRQPERSLFPGFVIPALAVAGLVPPLGVVRLAYVAGLVVAFDGSLGFNGWSYPYLYDWFSAVRGLRVPARFSVLVALSLAVLAGFGVKRLLALPRRPQWQAVIFAVTVAAVTSDVWPNLPLRGVWREPPPVYGALAGATNVVLAEFPVPADYAYNTPYMYFSLWHWAPMINGYSGFMPRSYDAYQQAVLDFPAPAAIEALQARGVTHVTVNCALYHDGCGPQLLQELDEIPALRKMTEGRWQGQLVRLYELRR